MEIISKLDNSQFNEVKMLYTDFFRSINFNNIYNDNLIKNYARRKARDIYKYDRKSKYFFAINGEEFIGFIHGKITDGIGLICHVYVKEEYRKQFVNTMLYRTLINWFKENDITTIEIEVNKQNRIYKNVERNNWQLVRDFDDASVFNRKI